MKNKIKKMGVFCGAREGATPDFMELAKNIGELLTDLRWDIVYGGSKVGLMGALADGMLERGGSITGVFTHALNGRETPHEGLTHLILSDTLMNRKLEMIEQAAAFLILPGGYGTLDEFFEVLTLSKLGLHEKPIILFNYNGFWNGLLQQIAHLKQTGFVSHNASSEKKSYLIVNTLSELTEALTAFTSSQSALAA